MNPQTIPRPGKMLITEDGSFISLLIHNSTICICEVERNGGRERIPVYKEEEVRDSLKFTLRKGNSKSRMQWVKTHIKIVSSCLYDN